MTKRRIVVDCKFNTMKAIPERLDPAWIKTRYDIFCRFTLRSLKNQISQDFLAFLKYDPLSRQAVMAASYEHEPLPQNIVLVTEKEYEERILDYIADADQLFIARIDSDDMYRSNYIDQLQKIEPLSDTEALINQQGYIYDSVNDRLAYWSHFSPPFYTLIYNCRSYRMGFRYRFSNGHRGAFSLRHQIMPPGNFMVVVHTHNISTHFNKRQRGNLIQDPLEMKRILQEFLGPQNPDCNH